MKRVYFISRPDTGLIKIGCSDCPEARRKQIGIDLKVPLTLLAAGSAPGGFWDEREVHRRFAGDRVEGEWFAPTAELLAYIEEVRSEGLLPINAAQSREQVIHRRRKAGETLQAIANDYDISRERVRQIVSEIDHGCSPRQRAAKLRAAA